MKYILFLSLLFQMVLYSACSKADDVQSAPELKLNKERADFSSEAANQTLTVTTNVESWAAKSDKSWCKVSSSDNLLKIEVEESEERLVREAIVTVTAQSLTAKVTVRQLGYQAAILVDKQTFEMPVVDSEIDFSITTNVTVTITAPDWIKQSANTRAVPMVTTDYTYSVARTTLDEKRVGEIMIEEVLPADADKDAKPITNKILVTQRGLNEYVAGNGDDIKGDTRMVVTSGTASSFHGGENIENSFDGDYSTMYHSDWNNGSSNYFPITLTYNFDRAEDVDYLIYHPRADGGQNGRFKEVLIEYSEDGNAYKTVEEADFKGSSTAAKVVFSEQLHAKSFRFTVKSGTGDGQGFASCTEMEFYAKNPKTFDHATLFTDATCSELKSGVTEEDIDKCEYPFFKNIAYHMLNEKYPSEFRIDEFKAYPDPMLQSKTHKTNPYSLLDNPTGISVKKDEVLIVFVGDTHGKNIGLKVQNLDRAGDDGFGGVTYPLSEGLNKLTMNEKGLVYVMYQTEKLDDPQAAPIKIHFASGTVNGYYDTEKHEGRWKELLNKATDKYFDVVGKYAHLTFETSDFRTHASSNGDKLIDVYDQIVYSQHLMMGLEKYNCMFRNRMYFNVMYHSYMYATSFHTGYNQSTMSEICNPDKLATSGCWGPAHEVGHCNQTRPGVLWVGMTEVTNNIMSQYAQTTLLGQPSRIQTEDMGKTFRNRYSKAWTGIIAKENPHADFVVEGDADDVFCKLVPLWQLELYFGNVLGKTPRQQSDMGGFYPEVYQYARENDYSKMTHGEIQLDFVYNSCKASGMNLLDFFEKWGFLREIDKKIDDYGVNHLKVTNAMADELRAKVNALGYPKPDAPFEYISDNTVDLFKTKAEIVAGKPATRVPQNNGENITIKDWKNVVVYEVLNSKGQVIYIGSGEANPSTTDSFYLPELWSNGYKLVAVSATGNRVEVPTTAN